ncbi:hypothetical protein ACTXT7_010050 [Hymenolepis weldensis]
MQRTFLEFSKVQMRREQSLIEHEEEVEGGRIVSLTELERLGMTEGGRLLESPRRKESLEIQQRRTSIPEPVFTLFAFLARQGVHISDLFRRPGNINQMKVSSP